MDKPWLVVEYFVSPRFVWGAALTLWITIVSLFFGILVGLLIALLQESKNRYLNALAVGYLCALSLWLLRRGVISPLAAVGRMALTAYVLESALALALFGGLRLYDRLSTSAALLVVGGIWTVLLIVCPLWLGRFQLGPLEWLWRSLTYGRVQRLSAPSG